MSSRFELTHDGREIPVTNEPSIMQPQAKALAASGLLTKWVEGLDPRFYLRGIKLQSIDLFGTRVGFVKFEADITSRNADGTSDGTKIPGIVFLRGDSVGILVVLECAREGDDATRAAQPLEEYAVLVQQPRVPARRFDFLEIAAGMLDGSGDFKGVAAKELVEELGPDFALSEHDLISLGEPIFLSPGGSDERMHLFAHTRLVTRAEIDALQGRLTGCQHENERISLVVVPLTAVKDLPNAGTQLAYFRYKAR